MICRHAPAVMNVERDAAYERFKAKGFPSKKVERYKYTDMSKLFEPDYGVNLNRLKIPVDPYEAFRCDVPNLSTSLYFMVNDSFFEAAPRGMKGESLPVGRGELPEGVVIDHRGRTHVTSQLTQLIEGDHRVGMVVIAVELFAISRDASPTAILSVHAVIAAPATSIATALRNNILCFIVSLFLNCFYLFN